MKVICSRENLIEGINIVQKAVSAKTTVQLLEGILLEAKENSFKLTANDLELGIECIVDADITNEGSIVINSKMLGDVVRRLPEAEILIEVKENNIVIIECENSHFELKGLLSDGYPSLPEIEKENAFIINQKILRDMIKQTIFAVSLDENRPVLTGTLIECNEKDINFVCIDGFRLAMRKKEVGEENGKFKAIVPGKTLNEVVKIIQPNEDEIRIYRSGNQILFDMDKCKIYSRLIEGEFVNYRSMIPKDYETIITVQTKELLSSIERASLVTAEDKRYPLKFKIQDDKIVISSSTDIGAVREEIRVKMDGKNLEIGFNPRYFIDVLKIIDEEEIEINYTTSVGPCNIKPIGGNYFSYIVVPVRMKSDS